ncbi:Nucleotide-binding alpha-beta plait domain [Phytophthora cactorum]|nr:Nucleotide-binding alpha-beta plait domain [Phytophthora cactorum]
MGRREEEAEAGHRHGRHRTPPSPTRGDDDEEAIRNKLRESGWKKRRTESESTAGAEASKDPEKTKDRADMGSPRPSDDRRASRTSRSSRRSRSPRRRDREHRSSRRKSSGSRRRSPSRSPASRSRSRSTGRRRRRHSSSSRKRRTSRSPSRVRDSKRSRRASRSTSVTKKKTPEKEKKDGNETETENEEERDTKKNEEKENGRNKRSRRRTRTVTDADVTDAATRARALRPVAVARDAPAPVRGPLAGLEDVIATTELQSQLQSQLQPRRRRDRSSSRDRPRRDAKEPAAPVPPAATETAAPVASATAPAAPAAGVNPTITQLMAQYPTMSLQDIIAKMQASNVTMAAALYVGNLPPNVTGPQLQEFLSTIIQQVGLTTQPGSPIINTWTSTDGHFAFCEMRSLSLLGQPLKFGRPRSFMGPPQPMPQVSARTQTALTNLGCSPNPAWFAQSAVPSTETTTTESTLAEATLSAIAAAQPVATEAGSGHRLVMSNIPVVLTEEQVKELVEPFGKLKSFTLVKDTATGASLGNALFEYEDSDVAAQAVEGLNGLSIGGILLSVQRQPPSSGAAVALPSAAVNPEDQPSPVLKMANMVSIDELRDDEEYADLAEDVEEECKRFGSVTGMEIPRPKDGEEVPGLGCIYIRFGKEEDAVSALKALNGRKFGGNIVRVTYFPLDKFEKNELF